MQYEREADSRPSLSPPRSAKVLIHGPIVRRPFQPSRHFGLCA